ncbi:MAG: hypothetical protein KC423_18430 [Anaerolineales bacterium]|nr:hypothetical protein [Anaerolineales bacterium]
MKPKWRHLGRWGQNGRFLPHSSHLTHLPNLQSQQCSLAGKTACPSLLANRCWFVVIFGEETAVSYKQTQKK